MESLLIEHFRAEKIDGKIIVTPDPNGLYRAASAVIIEQALTTGVSDGRIIDVKLGNKWIPMKTGDSRGKWLRDLIAKSKANKVQ